MTDRQQTLGETCPWCGRQIRTYAPGGGDGSAEIFYPHASPKDGVDEWCKGSKQVAND